MVEEIDISTVRGISLGRGYLNQQTDTYVSLFDVYFHDGTHQTITSDKQMGSGEKRKLLKQKYDEYHGIAEEYIIECDMYLRIDGINVLCGYQVGNILDISERKTLIEVEQLKSKAPVIDEGWRYAKFICLLEIEKGRVIKGRVTKELITQLRALGYTGPLTVGLYQRGEKIK